jgi:hypothetical protein
MYASVALEVLDVTFNDCGRHLELIFPLFQDITFVRFLAYAVVHIREYTAADADQRIRFLLDSPGSTFVLLTVYRRKCLGYWKVLRTSPWTLRSSTARTTTVQYEYVQLTARTLTFTSGVQNSNAC